MTMPRWFREHGYRTESIGKITHAPDGLFDPDGELIGRREAFLDATSVAAHATTGFRALFPGVGSFAGNPVFEARGRELVLEAAAESGRD